MLYDSSQNVVMRVVSSTHFRGVAAVLAAALCSAAALAGDDLQFEEHTIVFDVDSIEPDGSYQVVRNIPQFDTMGGTRVLQGVYESLETRISGHYTVHDNTSLTENRNCDTRYGTTWWGEIGGVQFSPMHEDYDICDCTQAGGGNGAFLAPLTAGWDGPIDKGAQAERLTIDPAKLAVLTGTGSVEMTGQFVIDPITKQPVPSPPAPSDSVFHPDLIDIDLHATEVTMILTYVWVSDEPVCPADLTDSGATNQPDGVVDVFDLLELLANWGTNGPGANIAEPANDIVDVFDLLDLLAAWGDC